MKILAALLMFVTLGVIARAQTPDPPKPDVKVLPGGEGDG
jgi:hypothetical protein